MTVDLAAAREHFLSLVAAIRPDLHRYASRLVGSAIDGEDIVQDALAKAFYALSLAHEAPPLRPWLFTITRNAAIDHLRRRTRVDSDVLEEDRAMSDDVPPSDPAVTRAALSAFAALPVAQRSAVILKDVLGESLEDIAAHLDTTVAAVKSLLVRGRQALRAAQSPAPIRRATDRAVLERYVALFNARDWAGVQAMLLEECRLDLVSKSERRGKAIGGYFGRYAQDTDLTFQIGTADGRDAIGAFRNGALAYVILLEVRDGGVSLIRDFRYVAYLAGELDFTADLPTR
jgi:RNA polymerase sigma-70 factor (ECF subfamily)